MNVSSILRRIASVLAVSAIASTSVQAADRLVVRMDLSPWGVQAAMQLAKEKKWFDEAGLDVEIQDGTGTISTLQLVGSGRVDVGQVQLGPMAIAKESFPDLISFAGFVRKGDLAAMVDKKLGVSDAKGLIGKKLFCFTTSPWAPFIKPFLEANGITPDQVNVVMVAPTAVVATYLTGEGDGFLSVMPDSEPRVRGTRPVSSVLLADSGITFPSYGLVATAGTLEKQGAALKKLAQIQVRAWDYIYSGHIDEAVAAIIAQRPNVKLDPVVLRNQIEVYRPFFPSPTTPSLPTGVQAEADWAAAIKTLERLNLIKPGHKPSDYFTNALVTK